MQHQHVHCTKCHMNIRQQIYHQYASQSASQMSATGKKRISGCADVAMGNAEFNGHVTDDVR